MQESIPRHTKNHVSTLTRAANAYRGIVQDGANVTILHLVKWVDAPDAIVEQLVENKTDSCTSGKLVEVQIVRISIDRCPEIRCELCDNRQDDVCRVVCQGASKRLQLCIELLLLLRNTSLDIWDSGSDMVHENLTKCMLTSQRN